MLFSLLFISCEKMILKEQPSENPTEVFNYLWNDLNERYSYFEYKNINWDNIKIKYQSQINDNMSENQLFEVLFDMLCELRDGHVNLISPFNISRYEFYLQGQNNYNERLIRENYITEDYYVTGPFINDKIINHNIGYIRYDSFMNTVSHYSIDYMIARFQNMDGLILDIRQNGGGSVTNIFTILSHFVDENTAIYQSHIKNGPEPDDFSDFQIAYAEPDGQYSWTKKPLVVLVDRGSFSASSFFALATKAIPNITLIGDYTGGGLGAPTAAQLPNGWTYRFSVSQTLTLSGYNYENGVPPDIYCTLTESNVSNGKDDIIETAIQLIENQ